ncbi:MAG: phosphoadenosine phosphosulfate reductase domain-containing protein [Acidiferrobacteraceae bacterium]
MNLTGHAPTVATTPEIEALIRADAAVAIGVSGGKDSQAAALATFATLDQAGHQGPRLLIHSDLGMVEWQESLPVCETLARHLGVELVIVRRAAGGLMERWEARWDSSVRRYAALETVAVVLPWSTPGMRFCTSELKTQIILRELRRRFLNRPIINVTGIRREESTARAKAAIADLDPRSSRPGADFWNWRPILDWAKQEVFDCIRANGLRPHRAYTEFGMSRTSCAFCIMSNQGDLLASTRNPAHTVLYRRMVALETRSTFAFQGNRWLADVAPDLLSLEERAAVAGAKIRAAQRVEAEQGIPQGLLYTKGWPTRMPTQDEAEQLAGIRRRVSGLLEIEADYLDGAQVRARFDELMQEKALREEGHARKRVPVMRQTRLGLSTTRPGC